MRASPRSAGHDSVVCMHLTTTDPYPEKGNLCTIGFIAVDPWWLPDKTVAPLVMYVTPQKLFESFSPNHPLSATYEQYSSPYAKMDISQSADAFNTWCDKNFPSKTDTKVQLVTPDSSFTTPWLRYWLGDLNFDRVFRTRMHCVVGAAHYLRTKAMFLDPKDIPFDKHCSVLNVRNTMKCSPETPRDLISECEATLETYRRLLSF